MGSLDKYETPKSSTGDTAHLVVKEILSFVHASGLFEYFFKSPLDKRREIWMNMVAEALIDLENARFDIDKLQSDEKFLTIVLQATTVAIKSHQKEKLNSLRNAIINSADHIFNEDIELSFIRYIDELTPSHLRLLSFLVNDFNDLSTIKSYSQIYVSFVETCTSSISRDEFIMLFQDLSARSLIRVSQFIDGFNDVYDVEMIVAPTPLNNLPRVIITDIGKQFINFITFKNEKMK